MSGFFAEEMKEGRSNKRRWYVIQEMSPLPRNTHTANTSTDGHMSTRRKGGGGGTCVGPLESQHAPANSCVRTRCNDIRVVFVAINLWKLGEAKQQAAAVRGCCFYFRLLEEYILAYGVLGPARQ